MYNQLSLRKKFLKKNLNRKVQADIQARLSSLKVEKKRFGWKEKSNILLRHNHCFLVHRLVIYHPSIFNASNCESLWGTCIPWHNGHDKPTHSHSWAMNNGVLSNEAWVQHWYYQMLSGVLRVCFHMFYLHFLLLVRFMHESLLC